MQLWIFKLMSCQMRLEFLHQKLFVVDRLQYKCVDDIGKPLGPDWQKLAVMLKSGLVVVDPIKKSTSYPLFERLKSCKVRPYVNLTLFVHLFLGETKKGGKSL